MIRSSPAGFKCLEVYAGVVCIKKIYGSIKKIYEKRGLTINCKEVTM